MKKKNNNPNTQKENAPNNTKWDEDYFCVYAFKRKPVNEALVRKLAEEYRNWAIKETDMSFEPEVAKREALRITDFLLMKGIPATTWDRWKKRFDFLKEADDFVRLKIGSRREYGAIHNKYNDSMVKLTLAHYLPEVREQMEFQASLKHQVVDEVVKLLTKEVTVEIPNFGSSPLVKERKKEK